jgi:ABC-2 type transport system permease protein
VKDLRVLRNDPRGLVTLFLMPMMFLAVMTLALGRAFSGAPGSPNVVQHSVPAWTLFGVFFIAQHLAASVLEERRLGTDRRLRATPAPRAALLLGKLLPFLVVNVLQVVAMFAAGVLLLPLLGAPRLALGSPAALLAITLGASLAATGLGLLIASLARTTEQVGGIGSLLVLTMAAVGGVMVPRAAMPPAMQTLGLLTPHAWALGAYQAVLVKGAGLTDVAGSIGALAGFAALFFGVALLRSRRE